MGEKQKLVLYSLGGLAITLPFFGFGTMTLSNMPIRLIVILMALSMSIAAKLFINQYIDNKQYIFINLLSLEHLIKLLVVLFHTYFKARALWDGKSIAVSTAGVMRFVLEFTVVDFIGILIILLGPEYNKKKKSIIYLVWISSFISIVLCAFLPQQDITKVLRVGTRVNLFLYAFVYCNWKRWEKENMGNNIIYIKVFVFFALCRNVVQIAFPFVTQRYDVAFSVLSLLQSAYLLTYTYSCCLKEPWNKRMNDLSAAENMIHKQSKACDMIVSLSHELKTPVNVIRSALDIIALDYKDDELILSKVRNTKKDCIEMMNIIQDMIDVQKIKGNHVQLKLETYNLVEVVENVVDAFSMNIKESPFVFNPQTEEIYQEIDLKLFQQALVLGFNLLIKSNLASEFYIEIGENEETQETYMLLKHDAIKQLVEEYWPTSTKKLKENSCIPEGLTLQLVQLIFQVHKISARSQVELGTIKMTFPKCTGYTEEWLDEENIMILGEKIKEREVVVNL